MEAILTWQFAVFTIGVFVFSLFARRVTEALFPTIRRDTPLTLAQRVWEKVLLPSIPVLVGIGLAVLVKSWPWPPSVATPGPRALVGAVSGFFSTWAYRVVKAIVKEKFKVDLDAEATLPVAVQDKKVESTPQVP